MSLTYYFYFSHDNFQLRKYEIEFRNRDQNQNVALQNALAMMQEKNATLEKNLSAETRIKLDLFSALGEARRQLEIKDSKSLNNNYFVYDILTKLHVFYVYFRLLA